MTEFALIVLNYIVYTAKHLRQFCKQTRCQGVSLSEVKVSLGALPLPEQVSELVTRLNYENICDYDICVPLKR